MYSWKVGQTKQLIIEGISWRELYGETEDNEGRKGMQQNELGGQHRVGQ